MDRLKKLKNRNKKDKIVEKMKRIKPDQERPNITPLKRAKMRYLQNLFLMHQRLSLKNKFFLSLN